MSEDVFMGQPDLKPDAKSEFFVATFTPTEMIGGGELNISGFQLDLVKQAFVVDNKGNRIQLEFEKCGEEAIVAKLEEGTFPPNTITFVVLYDGGEDWFPVGPLMIK
jgi:hypothetical protein